MMIVIVITTTTIIIIIIIIIGEGMGNPQTSVALPHPHQILQ